jgi:hypothetical protein
LPDADPGRCGLAGRSLPLTVLPKYKKELGGERTIWREALKKGWSESDSDEYEKVIHAIRRGFTGKPLWWYWPGHHKGAMAQDYWLSGFNFNVEEWSEGDRYETLAICRSLALARAAFEVAIPVNPQGGRGRGRGEHG